MTVASPKSPHSPTEFSIGHNVASEQEVDAVMEQAAKAGARIVKKAQKTFWGGYAGYFQDPDDHLWEVLGFPVSAPTRYGGSPTLAALGGPPV